MQDAKTIEQLRARLEERRAKLDLESAILDSLPPGLILRQVVVFGTKDPQALLVFRAPADELLTFADAMMKVFPPLDRYRFKTACLSFPAIRFLRETDRKAIDDGSADFFRIAPFVFRGRPHQERFDELTVDWYSRIQTVGFGNPGIQIKVEADHIPAGWSYEVTRQERNHHGTVTRRWWKAVAPFEFDGYSSFYADGEKQPFAAFFTDTHQSILELPEATE
jgi:hypothetical protein